MHKKLTLATIAAAMFFDATFAAGAQTATPNTADQAQTAAAPRGADFVQTRRVLAESNLCEWYRTGGITWDYAGAQTIADWTAATQAVAGDLRKVDPTLTGDALDRAAEQHIAELCAQQPTHAAGAI